MSPHLPVAAVLFSVGLSLFGCEQSREPRAIETTRIVAAPPAEKLNVPTALRFGYRPVDEPPQEQRQEQPTQSVNLFLHQAPDEWQVLPATPYRQLNFRVGGDGDGADLYVTFLTGGGVKANLDRWRGQMSLPPYQDADLVGLPTRTMLEREAVLVDLSGTFTAMDGSSRSDYRMIGLFAEFPAFAVSAKLVGPAELVEATRTAFLRFTDSLEFDTESIRALSGRSTGGGGPGAGEDAGTGVEEREPPGGEELSWDLPAGWQEAPGSMYRLVTFTVPERPSAECWITVLQGEAGGIQENLDRWRREMGRDGLTKGDIDALDRLMVLGDEAPLIEIVAAPTGQDESGSGAAEGEQGMMYGVIGSAPGHRVFIKMVGREADLRQERERLEELCRSLRWSS